MKPLQYIKKYRLDETEHFDHQAFMADFSNDFLATVEIAQNHTDFNLTHWNNLVKQARSKYDGIVNKSKGTTEKWEKPWKYFYATVVVKLRDELFGEVLAKKKAAYEARKKERQEFDDYISGRFYFENVFQRLFGQSFLNILQSSQVPLESFETLGLATDSSDEDIKKRFRELALKSDRDKGGSDEIMREIIQARNKCLAYANRNQET